MKDPRTLEVVGQKGWTLTVDSGWTHRRTEISLQTSRGQSVELTIEDWRELVQEVERIIDHCETKRLGKGGPTA